jgi:phosphatidylinositol alpha-1,6-mannosyltransferase
MSAPRRLVLASTDFKPMTGGVADHLHRLAEALARRTAVTVMTSVPQGGASWERAYALEPLAALPERRLGARPGDRFAPVRKLHTAAHFVALRRYADRMLARIADAPGDGAAVLVGIWDTASHFWCEACRRKDIPYALVAHGVELLIPLYGRLPEWRRADFAGAHRVVANSRATAALAVDRFGLSRPPAVVHPSVGPRPPAADIEARAIKLRRSLDPDASSSGPVILSVGRLVPRKGFDLVLHSVARLRRQYPTLRYLIVGQGPERMRLERLAGELGIASNVRMLGPADEITKWAAYEMCDLFVMPNRTLDGTDWEGFGIVFIEAALAGRAAIGGSSGGTADAVVDGETGLLVDPERAGGVTDAIRRLLDNRDERMRMGLAAARRAADRFSPAALADRFGSEIGWS